MYIHILGARASPPTPASVYGLWAVLRVRIRALVKAHTSRGKPCAIM